MEIFTSISDSAEAHNLSDLDSSTIAQHHTLGVGPSQASPGGHIHDGRDSKKIFTGIITGSRGGNAALTDLLIKLDAAGIITNNTVA